MAANYTELQRFLVPFLVVFITFSIHYQSYNVEAFMSGFGSGSMSKVQAGVSPLMDQTCRHTHYYDTCVSSLKSDDRSFQTSDVNGLLKISVDLATTNASHVLAYVQNWIDSNRNTPNTNSENFTIAMQTCVEDFNVSIYALQYAAEVVDRQDYNTAESYLDEAIIGIGLCQLSIRGPGVPSAIQGDDQLPIVPLTNMNRMLVYLLQNSMDMLCYLSPDLATCT